MADARFKGDLLAFRPDGRLLAAADTNGRIRLLDAETGRLVQWLKPPNQSRTVRGLAFTPDGRFLAVAAGPIVSLWDGEFLKSCISGWPRRSATQPRRSS
jgi:WD40 repeat protein